MSAPPYSVSSDFGQLVGIRHLISGIDCAIAGAATLATPAAASPVTLMKSRRFIACSLDDCALFAFLAQAWRRAWSIRPANSIMNLAAATQKARPSREGRAFEAVLDADQPRVRDRIMKLSKVYSATCHHRYWSDR